MTKTTTHGTNTEEKHMNTQIKAGDKVRFVEEFVVDRIGKNGELFFIDEYGEEWEFWQVPGATLSVEVVE